MYECFACVCARCMCARYKRKLEEGIGCPGAEVTNGSELPCGCWEMNPTPSKSRKCM